jgi:Na+-transporting methylmalonyl-CoA/oxaloacetate decarboxylase gamma subunit
MSLLDGVYLGLTGISTVFAAMILVTLFVKGLSYMMIKFEAHNQKKIAKKNGRTETRFHAVRDEELIAAIAAALNASLAESQPIFYFEKPNEKTGATAWKISGRLKQMERKNY